MLKKKPSFTDIFPGITAEDTKYLFVIAALDQDTATRLLDLILNPPAEDKYQALKMRLLAEQSRKGSTVASFSSSWGFNAFKPNGQNVSFVRRSSTMLSIQSAVP